MAFNPQEFIAESARVLRLAKKPKQEEFVMIAKITGAGMIIIGLLGTIITLLGMFYKAGFKF